MATRTVKARVEIDGEQKYKQALAELNSGNRVLASEMKKLQAEYKGNADSVEFLNKKGDLLQRQLQQQKDKVQTLRDALANAAERYGEADKRTQDWIVKLNNAEAAQFDLEHAIEENNQAITGQNEKMQGLGDVAGDLASKLGINIPAGAKDALNGMGQFSAGTVAKLTVAVAAVTAMIEAVKALHKTTMEAAQEADTLLSDSMITGLSTTTLQQLQYAENLIDVSASTITGSLTKLTNNMQSASQGNTALADSFKALGVSIVNEADGSLRSAEDVFFELIDALGQMQNQTERDAVAMDLFGKSAQELNPLIIQGTDALRGYMQAASENYVLTEDELAILADVDDALQQQTLTWNALKNQIAVQFAPASQEAIEQFTKLIETAGKVLIDSKIIEGFAEILKYAAELISPITDLLGLAGDSVNKLQPVYVVLHSIAGVLAWIADAANVVAGLLTLDFGKIGTALGFGASTGNYSNLQKWQGMGDTTGNYYNAETGMWQGNYGYNATGNDNWRGGLTWVGESGPELVSLPSGSQIMNAQDSRSAGDTFYITIDAKSVKEFNDIVRLVDSQRVRQRMR